MQKKAMLIFLLSLFSSFAFAQNLDYGWTVAKAENLCAKFTDKEAQAKEHYIAFGKNLSEKQYKNCVVPAEWLLANYPCLHENFYINLVKIYNILVEEEKDTLTRIAYQDKELALYDKRIERFGKKINTLEKKGNHYYSYLLLERPVVEYDTLLIEKMYLFYKDLISEGDTSLRSSVLLVYYMDLLGKVSKHSNAKISRNFIIEEYEKLQSIIDYKIALGKNKAAWEETKVSIDGILESYVDIDCEFITKYLYPKFLKDTTNTNLGSLLLGYVLKIKDVKDKQHCYKTLDMALLFRHCRGCSIPTYVSPSVEFILKERALANATEPKERASLLLKLAKLGVDIGKDLQQIRAYALEAAETHESVASNAYSFIGDLYIFTDVFCKEKVLIKSKYVFLAAYDMYEKAQNEQDMRDAKQKFPTKEEIKKHCKKEGKKVKVGCWIQVETILRSRD